MKEKRIVIGLIALMCILGIVWAQVAFAFPNEPTGFRGNGWGAEVEDLTFKITKVYSLEEIKVDFYDITHTNKVFKGMIIALDNKFAAVITKLPDPSQVEEFSEVLLELYGIPTSRTEDTVMWVGKTSTVEFSPLDGVVIIGSTTAMQSLEALFDWYVANIKKQAI